MLFWLLLGLGLLGLVLLFARWYAAAPIGQARRAAKVVLWIGAGLLVLLMMTRAGLPVVLSLAAALAPMAMGLRAALRRARAAQGPSAGGGSTVSSAWFEMTLDHETGAIAGTVLQGPHAGRALDDLDEASLRALAREVAGDPNSSRLLAAYLARRFGDAEPEGDDFGGFEEDPASDRRASGGMSRAEAMAVLGLEEGFDAAAVHEAYRRLIRTAHPDRGGSAYLAAKINEARDVLLGRN